MTLIRQPDGTIKRLYCLEDINYIRGRIIKGALLGFVILAIVLGVVYA